MDVKDVEHKARCGGDHAGMCEDELLQIIGDALKKVSMEDPGLMAFVAQGHPELEKVMDRITPSQYLTIFSLATLIGALTCGNHQVEADYHTTLRYWQQRWSPVMSQQLMAEGVPPEVEAMVEEAREMVRKIKEGEGSDGVDLARLLKGKVMGNC